jgi:hypothetical protein
MPMAAMSRGRSPPWPAPRARWPAGCARSRIGSCSTQPGCGVDLAEARAAPWPRCGRGVEDDAARAGGALVEGEQVTAICRGRASRRPCCSSPRASAASTTRN